MSVKTCRDCQNVLAPDARGCPRCALNFEAENMIDRFVWLLISGLLIVVLIIVALIYLLS